MAFFDVAAADFVRRAIAPTTVVNRGADPYGVVPRADGLVCARYRVSGGSFIECPAEYHVGFFVWTPSACVDVRYAMYHIQQVRLTSVHDVRLFHNPDMFDPVNVLDPVEARLKINVGALLSIVTPWKLSVCRTVRMELDKPRLVGGYVGFSVSSVATVAGLSVPLSVAATVVSDVSAFLRNTIDESSMKESVLFRRDYVPERLFDEQLYFLVGPDISVGEVSESDNLFTVVSGSSIDINIGRLVTPEATEGVAGALPVRRIWTSCWITILPPEQYTVTWLDIPVRKVHLPPSFLVAVTGFIRVGVGFRAIGTPSVRDGTYHFVLRCTFHFALAAEDGSGNVRFHSVTLSDRVLSYIDTNCFAIELDPALCLVGEWRRSTFIGCFVNLSQVGGAVTNLENVTVTVKPIIPGSDGGVGRGMSRILRYVSSGTSTCRLDVSCDLFFDASIPGSHSFVTRPREHETIYRDPSTVVSTNIREVLCSLYNADEYHLFRRVVFRSVYLEELKTADVANMTDRQLYSFIKDIFEQYVRARVRGLWEGDENAKLKRLM